MKRKYVFITVLFSLCLLLLSPSLFVAAQPESSYWFPEKLLDWSPDNDPDAVFNRSQIPLAERDIVDNVNDHAQSKSQLVALSALNSETGGVPSQGDKEFFVNTFSYWQYTDLMVYWAGSSDEGIIVPPSADVIDAAHKNGVPILGNIFFPPEQYGGKIEWLDQMLEEQADGSFLAADKLLEVADYYGFDGWFINQETDGGDEATAQKMKDFLAYLQEQKPDDMQIMWYDSMTDEGTIDWQNALTDQNSAFLQNDDTRVSDSMFLNFWWDDQQASYDKAQEIGRSPYDLFTGIDVEADGIETDIPWSGIFPEGEAPLTSLGIYRPDWTYSSSDNMAAFYEKENEFWVGGAGNPAETSDNGDWKGMAHYFNAKSAINELPFVTHFNTGSGEFFAVDGQVASEQSWNNRSMQDILPTWRWLIEGGQDVNATLDWEDAYYGGSALKLSGAIYADNPSHVKLYKTNLPVQKDTEIALTYKTDGDSLDLKLGVSFTDDPDAFVFFDVDKYEQNEWVTESFDLGDHSDKEIGAISLFVAGEENVEDFTTHVGEIKVYNPSENDEEIQTPKNVHVTDVAYDGDTHADVKLSWASFDENVSHYEIYHKLSNGDKVFVGATPNDVYYISELIREDQVARTDLEIVAVNQTFERSEATTVAVDWPVALEDLSERIEHLQADEEIFDEATAHDLTLHMVAIEHFANEKQNDKVVKHLYGMHGMLDNILDKAHISEKAHQILSQQTERLIEKYQGGK